MHQSSRVMRKRTSMRDQRRMKAIRYARNHTLPAHTAVADPYLRDMKHDHSPLNHHQSSTSAKKTVSHKH